MRLFHLVERTIDDALGGRLLAIISMMAFMRRVTT